MPYNNETSYTPRTANEIFDSLLQDLNEFLLSKGQPPVDATSFLQSDYYFIFYLYMQATHQVEVDLSLVRSLVKGYLNQVGTTLTTNKLSTPDALLTKLKGLNVDGEFIVEDCFLYTPNMLTNATNPGETKPVIKFVEGFNPSTAEAKLLIATAIAESIAGGIVTLGEVEQLVSFKLEPYKYRWTVAENKDIFAKITYKGNSEYGGLLLTEDNIKDLFLQQFNANYSLGSGLFPEVYTNVNQYAGAFSVNCEFSKDGSFVGDTNINRVMPVLDGSGFTISQKDFVVIKKQNITVVIE